LQKEQVLLDALQYNPVSSVQFIDPHKHAFELIISKLGYVQFERIKNLEHLFSELLQYKPVIPEH